MCLECGYWLRGLTDDIEHCPECGTPRPLADGDAGDETLRQ
jgi:hypothetical protein